MFKPNNFSTRVKQDISAIPFDDLAHQCNQDRANREQAIDSFGESYGLKHKGWIYPQALAHVGKWTLSRNECGISAKQMLADNVAKNAFNQGIYYLLTSNTRFVAKQSSPEGLPYCAFVPLILAAHKKMNGVSYSSWDRNEVGTVINSSLYDAITVGVPEYTLEEILQFRTIGLTTKSGAKAGTVKSATTTYGLNGLPWVISPEDDRVGPGQIPQLLRMMVCQTWCAHPTNRNQYMILDPHNWDQLPPALIVDDPLPKAPKPNQSLNSLPWETF